MDEFLVRMFLEILPAFCEVWRSGHVSRWSLSLSLVASFVLPIFALGAAIPLTRALLWATTTLAWAGLFGCFFVGYREIERREKSPGASPPRGQSDQSASDVSG